MDINLIIGIIGLAVAIIGVIAAVIIGVVQIRITKQPTKDDTISSSNESPSEGVEETDIMATGSSQVQSIRQEVSGDFNAVTISGDAVVNVTKK